MNLIAPTLPHFDNEFQSSRHLFVISASYCSTIPQKRTHQLTGLVSR